MFVAALLRNVEVVVRYANCFAPDAGLREGQGKQEGRFRRGRVEAGRRGRKRSSSSGEGN